MTKWSADHGTAGATAGIIRGGMRTASVLRSGGVQTVPAVQTAGVVRGGVENAGVIRNGIRTAGVIRGGTATADATRDGVRSARFEIPLGERQQLPDDVARRLSVEAQSAGYAAGWSEGRRAADVEIKSARVRFTAEAAEALAAATVTQEAAAGAALRGLVAAAEQYEQQYIPVVADLEGELITAAFALAEAIIGRELAVATEPGADALRRVLRFVPAGQPIVAHLNPVEAAAFPATSTVDGREVVIVPDPALKPGDAVVRSDATTIESRIDAAIARAREALS